MSGHTQTLAEEIATGAQQQTDLTALRRELVEAVVQSGGSGVVVYDVGSNLWLIVDTSMSPLDDPGEYVRLATDGP